MGDLPDTPKGTDLDEDQSEIGEETAMENAMALDEDERKHQDEAGGPSGERPSSASSQPTDYSLFSNPPSLGLVRQRLFDVEDPVELSQADFERYWPYVDNIWHKNRGGVPNKEHNATTEMYFCRLKRASHPKSATPHPTPEGKKTRKKRAREDLTCPMSLKVIHTEGVVKSCRIVRSAGKEVRHTHNLDYLDGLKRNSAIMNTARREAVKGYLPPSIFSKLWEEPEEMLAAGGKFMKVSDVRNVQYAWRQENPSARLRAHAGFSAKFTQGRRQMIVGDPLSPSPTRPPVELASVETTKLPPDTLRYPSHAREFLDAYLPPLTHPPSRMTPHITLTYASSLDGKISLAPGIRTTLSGPESKSMTHFLRSRHDAILIGVRTAIADDPSLNCRLAGAGGYGGIGWAQQPRPVIIDPHARLVVKPDMKMLRIVSEGRARAPWIVVAPGAILHPTAVSTLKAHGGEYLMVHDYQPHQRGPGLNWEGIFGILFNEGIKSIMVEGGGMVLSELLREQYAPLIDSVIVTIAPTFLGKAGVSVSPDPTLDEQGKPMATRLRDVKWQPMGAEDVIMCAKMGIAPKAPPGAAGDQGTNGILPGIEEFSQEVQRPDVPAQQKAVTSNGEAIQPETKMEVDQPSERVLPP